MDVPISTAGFLTFRMPASCRLAQEETGSVGCKAMQKRESDGITLIFLAVKSRFVKVLALLALVAWALAALASPVIRPLRDF
jgi:hypothetical protein